MLKIRLQRVGRKHEPSFRLVVTDSKNGPKSGKSLEVLGSHDTRENFDIKKVNVERIKHWISHGASVSDTVYNYLVDNKIIEGKKKNVLPRKSPVKSAETEAAAGKEGAPAAAAAEAPKQEAAPSTGDAPVPAEAEKPKE